METERGAIERFRQAGYVENLWVDADGSVASGSRSWPAEAVVVHDVARFEGESNPDDLSMVLAVEVGEGTRGVLSLPYGPDLSGPEADTVRKLASKRPT